MPTVSVIMPVYNVARYVRDSIHSVLAQTFTDFELIIVDDGSTDASPDICRSFDDPRIEIIRQANRGLAGARNTGIRAARGRYVALLDSDDLWQAEKLAAHVAHLDANPDVGVSFDRSTFIDDDGRPLGIVQSPRLRDISPAHVLLRNPIGNGSAPMFRREVFEDIATPGPDGELRWFDESFRQSEDIECWVRIALSTRWKFQGLDAVLTLYRVSDSGLSANIERQLESWERMMEKTRSRWPAFVEQWSRLARAYQLRYLARRAVRQRQRGLALTLVRRALAEDWTILPREPKRTLGTLAAITLLNVLPKAGYERIEGLALRFARPARTSDEARTR